MEEKKIRVFVKRNENNEIIDINSEIFIDNFDGWEFFDEGFGDRYSHAQNKYFDKPLQDESGKFLYK